MKFYELTRNTECNSYDVVNSIIVVANNPKQARKTASKNSMDEGSECWLDPKHSTCRAIHTKHYSSPETICVNAVNG